MDDAKAGYQATPNATLEQQMMDACAPKSEREWWAFVEIGRLRAEVEALRADAERWRYINELAHAAYLRGVEEGKRQAAAPQQAAHNAREINNLVGKTDSQQAGPVTSVEVHCETGGHAVTFCALYADLPVGRHDLYLHPPAAEVQRLQSLVDRLDESNVRLRGAMHAAIEDHDEHRPLMAAIEAMRTTLLERPDDGAVQRLRDAAQVVLAMVEAIGRRAFTTDGWAAVLELRRALEGGE